MKLSDPRGPLHIGGDRRAILGDYILDYAKRDLVEALHNHLACGFVNASNMQVISCEDLHDDRGAAPKTSKHSHDF